MKPNYLLALFACIAIVFLPNSCFAQNENEKTREKRIASDKQGDSAWSYKTIRFGRVTKYFFGEMEVTRSEFKKGIAAASDETALLIRQHRTRKLTGWLIGIPGMLVTAGSTFVVLVSQDSNTWIAPVIIAGGSALIAGTVFIISGDQKLKKAISLFNKKAREGSSQPTGKMSVSIGLQQYGLGVALCF